MSKEETIITIELIVGDTIRCKSKEVETNPHIMVGVEIETREGFIIPMSNVKTVWDGVIHDS